MPHGASSPVQGRQQQVQQVQQVQQQRHQQLPQDGKTTLSPPSASSTPCPKPTTRRIQQVSESGSPNAHTSSQSPLRNLVSYSSSPNSNSSTPSNNDDERDDLDPQLPTPPSLRGVIDFANSQIGRVNMSFTGDRRGRPRRSDASELHGSDASSIRTKSETPTPKNPSPAAGVGGGSSRFAVFASSMFKGATNSTAPSPVSVSIPQDDELMNMDIETALFPKGNDGEAFSPAAYKNLQQTATGLLGRFQSAYQERTIALQEIKAERGAQEEEKEEAETKMHHLKLQLEDMARKASEQEAVMQSLMEELARERKQREKNHQAREKGSSVSEGSTESEDLGAEEDQRRRKWRRSGGTLKSDMGFETDDESIEEASVFSRSRSPTIATTMTDLSPVEPPLPQIRTPVIATPRASPRLPPPPTSQHQHHQPQMNTFQKLFKGISGDPSREGETKGPMSCRNCEGQDASVAWDTVNLLKDENKGLKERVGDLETAVEGALDVVNGIRV